MSKAAAIHGGPDALGVPLHDFSTNANACGPCPNALAAIAAADATCYPDPSYHRLRERIADFHGVASDRIHFAASASEFISRITAAVAALRGNGVAVPQPGYGDYARAAQAHGLSVLPMDLAQLVWICDPASPTGQAAVAPDPSVASGQTLVIDRAYAPLRLQGDALVLPEAWEMWTPNKALGLTGIRGAYAIAPAGQAESALAERLQAMLPSWPIGAHGVALLESWTDPQTQKWLTRSRDNLRDWKRQQIERLESLGWHCMPGDTSFFCAKPSRGSLGEQGASGEPNEPSTLLQRLRTEHGIKLRDTTSMGLPGCVRLNVLAPASQQALHAALL